MIGIELSVYAGDSFLSLMRSASLRSVSIVNLLLITLLPFLFSALIVYIRGVRLLAGLCFIKGLSFAFVSGGLLAAYGDAGWLIQGLYMFSDVFTLIPLWWCWLQLYGEGSILGRKCLMIGGIVAGCIVFLDYLYVSPFLAKLFEY